MTKSQQIALIASTLRRGMLTASEQKEISKKLVQLSHLVAIDEKIIDTIVEEAIIDWEAKCFADMPPQFQLAADA